MENIEAQLRMQRAAAAEAWVRHRVMVDQVGGMQELMTRNVGARLAAEHCRLMASVSQLAIVTAWRWQAEARAAR